MEHYHQCTFCGWSREATSDTVMPPDCEGCGAPLRVATAREVAGYDPDAVAGHKPTRSPDITGVFAVFVLAPVAVSVVGISLGSLVFGVPFVLLWFGATRAWRAASHASEGRRWVWLLLCGATSLGALASAITIVTPADGSLARAGFYLGLAASALMLAAMWRFARIATSGARLEGVVDAALLLLLITALAAYFVAIPGFLHGDFVLTFVFILDLSALLFASFAAVIRPRVRHRRIGSALIAMTSAVAVGDAFVALATTGLHISQGATALLWAVAGFACAYAADEERPDAEEDETIPEEQMGRRWVMARVVFPLVVVLAFPGTAVPLWASGHLSPWAAGYYGVCFVLALTIAFGRQAYLIIDNRLAVARERTLREDAVRRSEQLEALTGLATTMTQTLEEEPIVKRALSVLHTAARATSSAIHLIGDGPLVLRASRGNWYREHPWADQLAAVPVTPYEVHTRGRRNVVRLALRSRAHTLGTVTIVRPKRDRFEEEELGLLCLLVDELAVAIQHARDYHERLEESIRDPLTGLYNRRFFLEAVGKEIARTRRYGSPASLALIDIDNFKEINDTFGHAAGDAVLRRLGEVVEHCVRPMDTFARIGGEEFGLLLPQTTQLDALMVADRVRTAIGREDIVPGRKVTVSGGIASSPDDGVDLTELHRKADAALYWCKRHGKDMCAVASEAAEEPAERHETSSVPHLYGIVEMLDAGPLQTRAHSQTVAAYAVAIAQELGLGQTQLMKLRRAALLHDVGKVSVPSEILNKPASLTDEEFELVRGHAATGGLMLAHAGLGDEARWVRWHHERVDGRGYPDGLCDDQIPLEARILFVADSFEAMTSDRPYRAGMAAEEALAELERCAGSQFEPVAVATLARLVRGGTLSVLALRDEARSRAIAASGLA